MEMLPISVIIAAKNAESTIEECLISIQRNNPAEIIVVDGVSTDKTLEIVRRYTQRIYSDEGKGTSYAHQLGIEQATQEYIAYIDADIILPEGTLVIMLAELEESGYACIQARLLAAKLSTYWERAIDWNVKIGQNLRPGGLSASLLKRDTALKVKFDTLHKVWGDDYVFLSRLKNEGYTFGTSLTPVYHHHRADLENLAKQRFQYGRSHAHYMKKYGFWYPSYWRPLVMFYWIILCLIKLKPVFIPYFILVGVIETAGTVKGLFELITEWVKIKRDGKE
jgi:glycosyltransferase involved in cell wall biosynthesis